MSMTRREFLRRTGIVGGGIMVAGGLAGLGKLVYDEINNSTDKELLRRTVNEVINLKNADDPKSDVYLGNVNGFDKRYNTQIPVAFDPTQTEPIILPKCVTNAINHKKDEIRIIYLDSGFGNPYRQKMDNIADVIKDGIKNLLPNLNLQVSTDILPWKKGMVWYSVGPSNQEIDESFKEGEYLDMASDKKYILLAEDPEIISSKLAGCAGLFSNFAGVRVPQKNDYPENFFYRTILHELGHEYGLKHCWEPDCAMSYDFLVSSDFNPALEFNSRCKKIGANIINGKIVTEKYKVDKLKFGDKEIENPYYRATVQSANSIPYQDARDDLDNHLTRYLSDVAPDIKKIKNDLTMWVETGEFFDYVGFSKMESGKRSKIGRMRIDEFVHDIEIY